MMTNKQQELFNKLNHWQIDSIDTALPFSKRLARENGWSHAYAKHVTEEYKKFIFLAVHAGHPVTPSEAVDQAWHLHLAYTKSYWEDLCDGILGQKLHHNPTKGGKKEDAKFEDWYTKTLTSYQRFFGEVPPTHIWPTASERFQKITCYKKIDTSKVWLLPKPKISVPTLSFVLITFLSGLLIGCSGDPVATGLLIGFGAIGFIIFIIIRLTLRIPKPVASRQKHKRQQNNTTSSSSSSDSSSSFSNSDYSGSSGGATAAGFAGFGGGLFGGAGAGGDYSDSGSNDSSSSDSGSSDSGGDSGSSGCSSGCGGGGGD